MPRKKPLPPVLPIAANVIAKCGGHAKVADTLKIDVSRVYRFTYPSSKGGTGGLIPAKYQSLLLTKFAGLEPADFFNRTAA